MAWTEAEIAALVARRGLERLTAEHRTRMLEIARAQPDTLALREAVMRKEDRPHFPKSRG